MKKLLSGLFSLFFLTLSAQTITQSEDIFIGSAQGYGIIGKINDRILFFTLDDSKVKVRAMDGKLHKLWDKEIIPDRKNHSKVLEVLSNRQEFNVVYQFRKKGHNYIKVHKYDGQVKLLDSVTVYDWGKDIVSPNLNCYYSEDRRVVLLVENESDRKLNVMAFSLDSLKKIWSNSFEPKNWNNDEHLNQILVNNNAEAFFITEENTRGFSTDKRGFTIYKVQNSGVDGIRTLIIPFKDIYNIHTKFSFDNINRILAAAGLYSSKNYGKAQGYYFLKITPQLENFNLMSQPFEDEFLKAAQGKKVNDNKGFTDIKVQEVVHKRDGGILAIFEEVKEVSRNTTTLARSYWGVRDVRFAVDYFYDNVYAISMNNDGITQWKSIFYKKQASQDDDGKYCSYFLLKTPSALRLIFNDEIERATTVSEYIVNGSGQSERHTIFNTGGQDVTLRFRDAMQIAANEVIVPSDDRRRVKLIKIEY